MLIEEIQKKYNLFKANNGDDLLIKIGIVGVLIGWVFSMSFLNQLFAWFLLVGVGIKLYDYVIRAQRRLNNEDNFSMFDNITTTWSLFKEKKGDTLLIKIGIVGVIIGLVFSISILNQIFAWFILLGVGIKLYDYVLDNKNMAT